ncbi:glyoxalase/bleomycin resistance/extradiol dioxygenase family protein [Nocardioides sp.]|uniref:VOC family protein n=1 Tax=Nocardioides sp. TaxID=35761 RepID=UPI002717CB19|nr:VOC family protein [Nocardioides sp.]MDO9455124.1 VOC family protein [Nocardioides sp.]
METKDIKHWQSMSFRDVDVMSAWLAAIGFREHAAHRDEADPSVVVHGEWVWAGGGLMAGSARDDSPVTAPGRSSAYLVVDDPDAIFDAAVAAGATVERPMVDQDYGGRGGSVRDPEGNHWSFGSYQPR